MDFKDEVVLITGSSFGIGASTAVAFAKFSAKIVIVGRNEHKLKEVSKLCEETNGIKSLVVKAELTNDTDIKRNVDETIKTFGQIDVVINKAGVGGIIGLNDGIERYDKIMSTNLRSVYLLTSLVVPYLIKSKGNIINVSSVAEKPVPEFLPYCMSKAGLDMFTKCKAKQLANRRNKSEFS